MGYWGIATGAVQSRHLADEGVAPADLAPGAVTEAKIGAAAVTADKIGAAAVTADKLAANTVTPAKLDRLLGLAARGPIPTLASLSRASIAYDNDGVEFAADEGIWETVAVASPAADLTLVENEGGAGVHLVPQCATPTHLYAFESGASNNIWRRTLAGGAWTKMATRTGMSCIRALSDGAILISVAGSVGVGGKVYYSSDGGATERLVATLADNTSMSGWSRYRYQDDGTNVVIGEYDTICVNLYHATLAGLAAGGSFALTHTFTGDDTGTKRHTHALAYHAATNRWLCFRGDGVNDRVGCSDDGGLTWGDLIARNAWRWHPMTSIEFGHATDLILGGDGTGPLMRFNVQTLAVRQIGTHDNLSVHLHAFALWYEDGLFYSLNTEDQSPADGKRVTLYVSPDAEHWTAYARFPSDVVSAYVRGVIGGQLQIATSPARHYTLAVPTVTTRQALLVHGACTNLLATAIVSDLEGGITGWTASGDCSVAAYADDAWHGSGCVKLTRGATATSAYAYSPKFAVLKNDVLFAMARVKAVPGGRVADMYMGLRFADGGSPYDVADVAYGKTHCLSANDGWSYLTFGPYVVPHDPGVNVGVQVVLDYSNGKWQHGDAALIDGLAIYKVTGSALPTRWQLGGIARTIDTLYLRPYIPTVGWTCVFTFHPDICSGLMALMTAGTKCVIASWQTTANDWAKLYFDPADDKKFTLEATDDNGVSSATSIQAAAQWFQKGSSIHFAVRLSAGDMSLSVANGLAVEHCAATGDTEYAGMGAASVEMRGGDIDGSAILPGLISGIRFYPRALTPAEVEAAMTLV